MNINADTASSKTFPLAGKSTRLAADFESAINVARKQKNTKSSVRTQSTTKTDLSAPVKDDEKTPDDVKEQWFKAVKSGNFDAVRKFIAEKSDGWDINAKDENGSTALHLATRAFVGGDATKMVKLLVSEGHADLAAADESGRTAYQLGQSLEKGSGATDLYGQSVDFIKAQLDDQAKYAAYDGDAQRKEALIGAGASDPGEKKDVIADLDARRQDHDLEPASGLDILSLKTGESDPKDEKHKLTVSELTWKNLISDWKEGIKNGDIAPDDDRAKLYRAILAKNASQDGLAMVGLDKDRGTTTKQTTGKDFDSIIDSVVVDDRMNKLLKSDSVIDDLQDQRAKSLDKVDNGEDVVDRLEKMATSTEYMDYLNDLKTNGHGDIAKIDIGKTYDQLMAADPEKADAFAQNTEMDSLAIGFNDLIAHPDQVSDDNLSTATQDVGKMIFTALKKGGIDVGRRLTETQDKFVQEVLKDKKTAKNFGKAMQELGATAAKNDGNITQKQIKDLVGNGKYTELNNQTNGGMLSTISALNKNGLLPSMGGFISLASAIYQLAGKSGTLADSAQERLSIAKDFVSFVGAGKHFANFASQAIDFLNDTKTNEFLALDKSLPDLFSKPKPAEGGKSKTWTAVHQQTLNNLDKAIKSDGTGHLEKKLGDAMSSGDVNKVSRGLTDGYSTRSALPKETTGFKKGASAALGVLNAGADTFAGIADSVIGGLNIKKGVHNDNPQKIAQGALQIASGVFGTAAGGASLAGLAGLNAVKVAAAPSFLISAILSVATVIPEIVQDVKNSKAMRDHRDELEDLFTSMDKDGLLTDDGLDRFRYLDAYVYSFGQRDAPGDQSIFDYRPEEFGKFMDGLDLSSLPDGQFTSDIPFVDIDHKDYSDDGDNIQTYVDDDKGGTLV